jgi:hypothetical protein
VGSEVLLAGCDRALINFSVCFESKSKREVDWLTALSFLDVLFVGV